jgi:hypothetical protein
MSEPTVWMPILAELAVSFAIVLVLASIDISPVPWWAPAAAWLAAIAIRIGVSHARASMRRIRPRRDTFMLREGKLAIVESAELPRDRRDR